MSKTKISSSPNRVIMTDVLPFESPITFSNIGLFNYLQTDRKNQPSLIKFLFENKSSYVPYKYDIKRKSNKYRTLCLIHPLSQIKFIKFYDEFAELIIYNCNKSKYSLRKPLKISKLAKSKEPQFPNFPSRFFVYGPYNFMYEFFDSFEFRRLEKKFSHLARIDISKCFDSIYTHSISWAIKDKSYSKNNINKISFEHEFDKKMQYSNYNETNGIVIGPEFSRLFAEIILQDIDINIEKGLREQGLKFNTDYSIRRYVDDYHIYSSSKDNIDLIVDSIESELKKFNLFINESKTDYYTAPFISNISLAKIQISSKINIFYKRLFKYDENFEDKYKVEKLKKIIKPQVISNQILNELKSILVLSSVSISDISKYILSVIGNKLKLTLNVDKENEGIEVLNNDQQKNFEVFITIIIDLIYSVIALNIVPKNTIFLCQFVCNLQTYCKKRKVTNLKYLQKRILDETLLLFNSLNHKEKDGCVESSNILITLSLLGENFELPEIYLINHFNIVINSEINYFKFSSLLYYIKDKEKYNKIREMISKSVLSKFRNATVPMISSEFFVLFFDYINCPYINKNYKEELIDIVSEKHKLGLIDSAEKNRIIKYTRRFSWFTQWKTPIRKLLKYKEYAIDY